VRTVPSRLQQALSTLLAASADAVAAGGSLTLTSRRRDLTVECEIVDTRDAAVARTLVEGIDDAAGQADDDATRALVLARTIVSDLGARLTLAPVASGGLAITVALDVPAEGQPS
jgi:hypothetical protein